jgi:hypothetical protein
VASSLVPLLVIGIAVAAALFFVQREKEKDKKAAALAQQLGLGFDATSRAVPASPFEQFNIGRSRKMYRHFWRPGDPRGVSVFAYSYVTGSGKNQTTHQFTCATFATPLGAPHLVLDRQGFFRDLLNRAGMRDIEVESPQFNDTWHVSCQDERFAITFLDPTMITWLMSIEGGAGSIEIELWGDRGLAISRPLAIEQMPQLFGYVDRFLAAIPRVVPELYPKRPGP